MTTPWYGIVEGFYGPAWSWAVRQAYPAFLASVGLDTYLYAPKSDPFLRARWHEPWPAATLAALETLAASCRAHGVRFGVGLSPVGIETWPARDARRALEGKLDQICSLGVECLGLLFDDMPVAGVDAAAQVVWAHHVADTVPEARLVFCPSYYSDDPQLETVFGARPANYFPVLRERLREAIDVFWTGPRVCSPGYTRADMDAARNHFGRYPMLWDNYPVNDGRLTADYLFLGPFRDRPASVMAALPGILANPMVQPHLSRLPLATLTAAVTGGDADAAWETALARLCPAPLAECLRRDRARFAETGREALRREAPSLAEEYRALAHPMATEVADWLEGRYAFDPACLTA